MTRRLLTADELAGAMNELNGWTSHGSSLKKSVKFENFADALAFVNRIGSLAEAADHHPDLTFGWGYADIALTTHDRDGITDVDIALARQIDAID